jgi:hypothetical protein
MGDETKHVQKNPVRGRRVVTALLSRSLGVPATAPGPRVHGIGATVHRLPVISPPHERPEATLTESEFIAGDQTGSSHSHGISRGNHDSATATEPPGLMLSLRLRVVTARLSAQAAGPHSIPADPAPQQQPPPRCRRCRRLRVLMHWHLHTRAPASARPLPSESYTQQHAAHSVTVRQSHDCHTV